MMRASKIALVAVSAAALLALAAGFAWWVLSGDDEVAQAPTPGASSTAPPSAQPSETPSSTSTEPSRAAPSVAPTPTPPGPQTPAAPGAGDERTEVTVIVTFADWDAAAGVVEVGAYAAATGESGTCTLTMTQAARSAQATQPAVADVSTMSCGGLTLPRADLPSGEWSAVVAYESSKSRGTSEAVQVRIP